MIFNDTNLSTHISIDNPLALKLLSDKIYYFTSKAIENGCDSIVLLCIGTDRSTGDSFGPLIGHKIKGMKKNNIHIFGTLEEPVHAKNLNEYTAYINKTYNKPFVIAVDACLGAIDHIGCISIGEGSIKPGSGVNKNLEAIGDMYITGIVNIGGFMEFFVLQNTRLSLVMKMADIVSTSVRIALWKAVNNSLEDNVTVV